MDTTASRVQSRRKSLGLEAALVMLLASNGVWFAIQGSASKATDSAAWLALLLLFLMETHFAGALERPRRRLAIRIFRLAAAAGVIAAAITYVIEGNRLDSINSALWIAVVVLLEAEIRWPALVTNARFALGVTAFILYGALSALVLVWLARAEWIDAYDAALWLVAFATLEVDVLRRSS